jgi:hypothetical protein
MGNASSKSAVTTNVKQVIDNQVDLKLIKETVNKNIMNSITENASSCSAQVMANQAIKRQFKGISGGKIKIGNTEQEQKVSLQLSCIDVTKIENNMANDIANAFANQLESKFDMDAMTKLESNAKTQAENGVLSLGTAKSDADVKTNYDINISNKISKTMKDIIKNETQKNFHTKTLKERLATLQANQAIEGGLENAKNIDYEEGNTKQTQTVDLVMQAIAEDQTINKTIEKISNQLNNIDVSGVTTKLTSDISASATSEAKQKGVDSIFDSLFNMLGNMFKGWMGMLIIGLIVVCVIVVVFFLTGGQETLQQGISVAATKMGGGELVYAFKSLNMNELLI